MEMKYKEEDIVFAHKILEQRDELDEREIESWLQTKEHVALLNELASGQESREMEDEKKSRQMTLRWSWMVAIVVVIALIIKILIEDS